MEATVFSVQDVPEHILNVVRSNFESVQESTVDNDIPIEGDLCIAIGGDGTYLEAAFRAAENNVPVLGVHLREDANSVGFLTRVPPNRLESALEEFLTDNHTVVERGRVSVDAPSVSASGLNEVMVSPTPPEKAVDRKVCSIAAYLSNDTYIGTYTGSGVAIATPTGSTGVALSAGGPIHYPNDNFALQLTPLQTHNMGVRPLVLGNDAVLELYADSQVHVMVDGGRAKGLVNENDKIVIKQDQNPAKLVRTESDDSYFDALVDSLGWSIRDLHDTGPNPGALL